MPTCVVGVDPGGTTGLARVYHDAAFQPTLDQVDEAGGEKVPVLQNAVGTMRFIEHVWPRLVIVEDFNSSGNLSRYGKDTIFLVGYVVGACNEAGIPVVIAQPAQRRSELHSLQDRGLSTHKTDALAHAMAHLRRERRGK